jgi:hypothetical protein
VKAPIARSKHDVVVAIPIDIAGTDAATVPKWRPVVLDRKFDRSVDADFACFKPGERLLACRRWRHERRRHDFDTFRQI